MTVIESQIYGALVTRLFITGATTFEVAFLQNDHVPYRFLYDYPIEFVGHGLVILSPNPSLSVSLPNLLKLMNESVN